MSSSRRRKVHLATWAQFNLPSHVRDSVYVCDYAETTAQTYTFEKLVFPSIRTTGTHSNIAESVAAINLIGGSGDSVYDVTWMPTRQPVEITADGHETLVGPNLDVDWLIRGSMAGTRS